MRIGKALYLTIDADDVIDGKYLKAVKNGEIEGEVYGIMDKITLKKLIVYLDKNDLRIKPGSYIINQADSFEKIMDVLEFEKGQP
jgi:hypothetical protein